MPHNPPNVKYWEIIADNLSKAGWSWGCVSVLDCEGQTIWIVDAHRDNGKRFIARSDEKLTAFLALESAIRPANGRSCYEPVLTMQFPPHGRNPSKAQPSKETVEPPSGTLIPAGFTLTVVEDESSTSVDSEIQNRGESHTPNECA